MSPASSVSEDPKPSSAWSWFRKRTPRSSPVAAEEPTEVKNTGTNYSIIHNTSAPTKIMSYAAPKGIYIWGGPGCGKTYLMDLLYNSIQCDKIRKARVDFHSFMLEINMKLHQLRQKYGCFLSCCWCRCAKRSAPRDRSQYCQAQQRVVLRWVSSHRCSRRDDASAALLESLR